MDDILLPTAPREAQGSTIRTERTALPQYLATSVPTALPNQRNATSETADKYFQELTLKHSSLLQGIYSHRKIHVNMTNEAKSFHAVSMPCGHVLFARKEDYFQINYSQTHKTFFFSRHTEWVRTVTMTSLKGKGVKDYFRTSTWTPALLPHREFKRIPWPCFLS